MTYTPEERTDVMIRTYGEVCTRAAAARILGRNVKTIGVMIADGRIEEACGGTMVDVRSIARYIAQPKQADNEARKRRIKIKYNSEFAV